uniref:Uncharacterized protein n=1 Tax=uncultured marine virus TaxID=186617 RepID=A0A0F7L8D9_9VIRU|nr:hypothetical protein [uncultured marine virus]
MRTPGGVRLCGSCRRLSRLPCRPLRVAPYGTLQARGRYRQDPQAARESGRY